MAPKGTLTPTQRRMFTRLMVADGGVVSVDELARDVLGWEVLDRGARAVIREHIRRLRLRAGHGWVIETVYGRGYRLRTNSGGSTD